MGNDDTQEALNGLATEATSKLIAVISSGVIDHTNPDGSQGNLLTIIVVFYFCYETKLTELTIPCSILGPKK